jgi:hypothetical protein
MEVTIGNRNEGKTGVRLAFADLHVPKPFQGAGEPAYSASFILDPVENAADIKAIEDAILAVATEKWAGKARAIVDGLAKKGAVCYKPGPKVSALGEVFTGYEGMHHIDARNGGAPGKPATKPTLVDADRTELTPASGKPYGGCYVIAKLDIWVQDNSYGTRINCSIRGVQFRRSGPAFSGGTAAAAEEFEDISPDADEFFA